MNSSIFNPATRIILYAMLMVPCTFAAHQSTALRIYNELETTILGEFDYRWDLLSNERGVLNYEEDIANGTWNYYARYEKIGLVNEPNVFATVGVSRYLSCPLDFDSYGTCGAFSVVDFRDQSAVFAENQGNRPNDRFENAQFSWCATVISGMEGKMDRRC